MKHRPIVRDGAAFVPPRELVDKVDKLLDGDAGSWRLVNTSLTPSVPASPTPALENRQKHVCFRRLSPIRSVCEAHVLANTNQ